MHHNIAHAQNEVYADLMNKRIEPVYLPLFGAQYEFKYYSLNI